LSAIFWRIFDDAVAALTLVLGPEDIAELEAPYVPHPVIGID